MLANNLHSLKLNIFALSTKSVSLHLSKHSLIAILHFCRVATPIAVAHKVMTDCRHNFLVGTGAQKFARDKGFTIEPNENLLPHKSQSPEKVPSHDTLAVIAVDENRHIAAGTLLPPDNEFAGR